MRYLVLFLASILMAAEPSVFEAGNLDSDQPYGLTQSEKHILQNKKAIKRLQNSLYTVQSKVERIDERVKGLESIVEGLDENVRDLKKRLKEKSGNDEKIAQLQRELNASMNIQKENFEQIKKILKELSSLIDQINSTYVTKDELKSELSKIYALIKKQNVSKKSGAQLFKEALHSFRKKEYEKAKELFSYAIQKHYKPATSNFYIAESCYYQKNYGCAVKHYKKSASLYQKASYMPTLLLHTAISLEKLGRKKEAKKFYRNLVSLYPKSKAAKIAKKKLK
ncbi:tetratricopeptide repeat protein [Nitratiruptor sp. SB155-2]|uniref:tetratricopeptide repeat protein n=1 Tax=Nitratiruptor sp. (strain SB155-2) TaxID=387092 RepID=UPI000158713D|nr:tetratricopeptide repeat protein [Nitratiruptor sp. SB155-2]BAF70322.1 conserved hypothetical protein [Nitratiruptor sp. SB155-2]